MARENEGVFPICIPNVKDLQDSIIEITNASSYYCYREAFNEHMLTYEDYEHNLPTKSNYISNSTSEATSMSIIENKNDHSTSDTEDNNDTINNSTSCEAKVIPDNHITSSIIDSSSVIDTNLTEDKVDEDNTKNSPDQRSESVNNKSDNQKECKDAENRKKITLNRPRRKSCTKDSHGTNIYPLLLPNLSTHDLNPQLLIRNLGMFFLILF